MSATVLRQWRSTGVVVAVLAILLAATAGIVAGPRSAPAAAEPDPGCSRAFPFRMTPRDESLHEAASLRLVFCQDGTRTATLIRNTTFAVWVVEAPRGVAVHRDPVSAVERSFLELVRGPQPVLPPGGHLEVPLPASRLSARVEPGLTIAALVHERLASALQGSARPGARDTALTVGRTALATCIADVLDELPAPSAVLSGGSAAPQIADAAVAVASKPVSPCRREWATVRIATGVPGARLSPLVQVAALWPSDAGFAFRALDAGMTYSALADRLAP